MEIEKILKRINETKGQSFHNSNKIDKFSQINQDEQGENSSDTTISDPERDRESEMGIIGSSIHINRKIRRHGHASITSTT